MIVAAMDIGSNTSLLLIARLSDKGFENAEIKEDQLFFTRLAEGFSKEKKIQPLALERQRVFFHKARELIRHYKADRIKCVATATARIAQNADQLFSLGKQYGFSLNIISPEEEAALSRTGALFQLPVENESAIVLDIGGASTEISSIDGFFSLPIGSVNLTEEVIKNDPPGEKEISLLMRKIQTEILSMEISALQKWGLAENPECGKEKERNKKITRDERMKIFSKKSVGWKKNRSISSPGLSIFSKNTTLVATAGTPPL